MSTATKYIALTIQPGKLREAIAEVMKYGRLGSIRGATAISGFFPDDFDLSILQYCHVVDGAVGVVTIVNAPFGGFRDGIDMSSNMPL